MNRFETSLSKLLREVTQHLDAGRKDAARDVLREALDLDGNNLTTWELLWRAAYNPDEELSSVKHILKIDPHHVAAKKRLLELQRSEEHTSELQSLTNLVCRLLL